MERFREMLLDVWREACQHIEIDQSTAAIEPNLAAHMPLERLVIHRLDVEHRALVLVASAPSLTKTYSLGAHSLTVGNHKKLVAWIRKADLANAEDAVFLRSGPLRLDFVAEEQDVRIAPLVSSGGAMGTLIFVAKSGERFTKLHETMIESLQEPFAVALENDGRLHEMNALREAAEADRRFLLRRMGRTDITDHIVGETTGLAQVMERATLVSQSDAPVLLLGETGSGKEVVARAIHSRSNRASGPFIRVNCGAIPPELIDSQLFGHEKGSFTGAAEMRRGWFERADGGTLFLDEIGELPLDAQVRFLRVLQDSFVERVGGQEPVRVDVRIVAATHRDLAAMVQDGQFREDLWYRIAVFPILLPPLRERTGDIPALAEHFAERAAVRFGLSPVHPSESDIRLLSNYSWPGNIRELGAVIDRAAILGDGRTLEIAAALGFIGPVPASRLTPGTSAANPQQELSTLDEAMKTHIEMALRQTKGRIEGPTGAARLLAINPHTLRARMRKLGVDWSVYR